MTAATTCAEEAAAMPEKAPHSITKLEVLEAACRERDIDSLLDLATSDGGLLSDGIRATAWPLLLGCHDEEAEPVVDQRWTDLPKHPDEEQVQKDVDRAFIYYPSNETQSSLEKNRVALFNVIAKVLRLDPMLHYFQGYHDIAQVFLLVLGEEAAFSAVSRVSLLRIRDYMLSSLSPAIKHLQLIPAILRCADPALAKHLSNTPPYFALSAVLTLYAHDIQKYSDIARLYDFVLAHEPVYAIYLFAALIISRRLELLDIPAEDHDMQLFTLSKLPQPLDLEALIERCLAIFKDYPPERLPGRAWRDISSYSVLKTSRKKLQEQSLVEAREMFNKQSQQLTSEEMTAKIVKHMRKNRRPIILSGATLLVGILSYYLRGNGTDRTMWSVLWRIAELFNRQ